MLRLDDLEFELLAGARPEGEELASFARRALLDSLEARDPHHALRRAASFVVACISPEITFEEALDLFDEHAARAGEGVANGRGH
jgi:hypothetical protein